MTEQKIEASSAPAPHDRADLAAAIRLLSEKIDASNEKQNEALMRLGYSTTTLSAAATDTLAAAKALSTERLQLSEIVTRPAPVLRQRMYIAGALVAGLIIGLVGPMIVSWISSAAGGQ